MIPLPLLPGREACPPRLHGGQVVHDLHQLAAVRLVLELLAEMVVLHQTGEGFAVSGPEGLVGVSLTHRDVTALDDRVADLQPVQPVSVAVQPLEGSLPPPDDSEALSSHGGA